MRIKITNELKNGLILVSFGVILYFALENINVLWQVFKWAIGIFSPFLLGLVIAFIINVPMSIIEKRLENSSLKLKNNSLKRSISLATSVFLVFLILLFVVALIIPDLLKTITNFINQVPQMVSNIQNLYQEYPWLDISKLDLNPEEIKSQLEVWIKTAGTGILTSSINFVVSFISSIANFVIALIFAFYILSEKEKFASQFKRFLKTFLKEKHINKFFEITTLANKTFTKFISGQCLEACILGFLCFIGMVIFRFPSALSISVLVALTALIPVFGAFIAMFIGVILIGATNIYTAFWFIIFFLILQQLEGNFIYPKVVGNSVGLPAIWTMMAVTIGGSCFGILGMLISVPVSSIIYALLKEFVKKKNKEVSV